MQTIAFTEKIDTVKKLYTFKNNNVSLAHLRPEVVKDAFLKLMIVSLYIMLRLLMYVFSWLVYKVPG